MNRDILSKETHKDVEDLMSEIKQLQQENAALQKILGEKRPSSPSSMQSITKVSAPTRPDRSSSPIRVRSADAVFLHCPTLTAK